MVNNKYIKCKLHGNDLNIYLSDILNAYLAPNNSYIKIITSNNYIRSYVITQKTPIIKNKLISNVEYGFKYRKKYYWHTSPKTFDRIINHKIYGFELNKKYNKSQFEYYNPYKNIKLLDLKNRNYEQEATKTNRIL